MKGFGSDVAGRSVDDRLATYVNLTLPTLDDEQESMGSLSVVRPLGNSNCCEFLSCELGPLVLPAKPSNKDLLLDRPWRWLSRSIRLGQW